jgi:hypothetical protein
MKARILQLVATFLAGTVALGQTQAFAADGGASYDAPWYRNLNLFAGLDGSKQPQDLGINANMGGRFSVDLGMPVWKQHDLGMHFGVAGNFSDAAVHVLDQIEGTSSRTQAFVSVGLFQRPCEELTASLGYDFLYQEYYDSFQLGQLRGLAGYSVTKSTELGIWFTKSVQGADGEMGGTPVRLDAVTQGNGYLKYTWPNAAETTIWAGFASGHDNVVWVIPEDSRDENVFVYGADLHMPLSERFAITGAANFLTPTSTGTVDAYLGLAFYPGRSAMARATDPYSPPMSVANNPTFSVDLQR